VGVIVYFPRLIFTLFSARNNSAITLSGLQTGKILFCYKSCELCNTLQHTLPLTATHCNTRCLLLQHDIETHLTATHCNTHCNTLQHKANSFWDRSRGLICPRAVVCGHFAATRCITRCNILQHTSTHCKPTRVLVFYCNTLQHTSQHAATHCKLINFETGLVDWHAQG